jgi:hypothetical protein
MTLRTRLAALVPLMMAVFTSSARAQAWLPRQGEGTVSVLFSDVFAKYHYLPTTPLDVGHIRTETLLVDVTYGLTDKVAITAGIPWVASKYTGAFPHPLADLTGVTPLDDGTYHQTLQDFRVDVRYNITRKGLVLTPFIGSIVPSHDYTYFAHTAPGRDLNELQLGVSAARMLDSLVPGLFVQGSYSYEVTEKVLDIPHNRSNISLEVGYFVTPKVRLLALGTGQLTHGGVDAPSPTDNLLFPQHDRITRDEFINAGGGAAYSLSENVDLFGSVIHTLVARNIHAIHRGLSLGLSWSFSTKRATDRAIANAEHSLVRCLCEKKAM